ncbi:MAG: hypothetical protein ABIF71_01700 [Planctomycetota bacterium]
MPFDNEAYVRFLLDRGVVGFFPEGRTLKSGRVSHWYANCRVVGDTAGNLETMAGFVTAFAAGRVPAFDYYYGVPEGGTKVGVVCNLLKARADGNPGQRVVMGRGTAKEHGDPRDRFFIGPVAAGDRVIVLEDVTTTGGSLLTAMDGLQAAGVTVAAVIAFVNRLERRDDGTTVAEAVAGRGVAYHAMATATDLLPRFIRQTRPAAALIRALEDELHRNGVEGVRLQ